MNIGTVSNYNPAMNPSAYGRMNGSPEYDMQLKGIPWDQRNSKENGDKKPGFRSSPEECETCKKRTYQDGSNEANVSFKSAAHISPQAAGAAVRAHENEHVNNAYAKAKQGGGEVVSASVSIHTSVCPECGRSYVSGGTTSTQIRYPNETNPYQKELKATDALQLRGANLDICA